MAQVSEENSNMEDANDSSKGSCYDGGDKKRMSSSSRVNFSKLSVKEQVVRFKNM